MSRRLTDWNSSERPAAVALTGVLLFVLRVSAPKPRSEKSVMSLAGGSLVIDGVNRSSVPVSVDRDVDRSRLDFRNPAADARFERDVEERIDAERILEIDRAAHDAVVDVLEADLAAFVERDQAEDDRIGERAADFEVGAAGEVGDVVAHGERVVAGEMQAQRDVVLPRRADDRRDAAAREDGVEQRRADVDVAEVERAIDGDVAGEDRAIADRR